MRHEDFEQMQANQNLHWWYKGRKRIISKIIKKLVLNKNKIDKPLNIIEIGAGTGANMQILSHFGNVTAMELDDYARSFIREGEKVSVVKGSLPNGLEAVEGKKFDLACVFDVIEHIEDDSAALLAIKTLLDDNGKILITVPAYQWLYSIHDENNGHYRRYTRTNLKELCTKNGLKILYSGYMNTFLFPLMVLARMADRLRKTTDGGGGYSTGSDVPGFGLNYLFDAIFKAESLFIPSISMPFGGSVICLCQVS